jgi:hypothetical protein
MTVYGTLTAATDVDNFQFSLTAVTDVTIDIESWEAPKPKAPMDFFGNGDNNDKLITNVYIFDSSNNEIASKVCQTCNKGFGCCPGDDAPGAYISRSGHNPYMTVSALPAGDYTLAIGAGNLSSADALSGSNSNGE